MANLNFKFLKEDTAKFLHFCGTENFRSQFYDLKSLVTRKYPLRGYFLGVLTHTTAWDQHWGRDETLVY